MPQNTLSIKEIEKLSYYDLMGYLDVPFFQIGGLSSTEKLGELCRIGKDTNVLVVGCGTGFNACHLARKFGCRLVGVDIAEEAIKKANERAENGNLTDTVEFRVGNAYDLPLEDNTFDVVITQFVSQFLNMEKALNEFTRVLKTGGRVGINEMFKDREMPPKIAEKIMEAERIIGEITELPFTIHTSDEWRGYLENAGLKEIEINENRSSMSPSDAPQLFREIGGIGKFIKLIAKMTKVTLFSKVIRKRFKKLDKAKKIMIGVPLVKTATSKHIGYILGVGSKK